MARLVARRAFLASSVATIATPLIACGGGGDGPAPEVSSAIVQKNGQADSAGLPLRFERLGTPRLAQLARRESLAYVAAQAQGEFDLCSG
jgi:hypothetical protein